jgi:hypothetical protein
MKIKIKVKVSEAISHNVDPKSPSYNLRTIITTPDIMQDVIVDVPDEVVNTLRNLFGRATMHVQVVGGRTVSAGEDFSIDCVQRDGEDKKQ